MTLDTQEILGSAADRHSAGSWDFTTCVRACVLQFEKERFYKLRMDVDDAIKSC